MTMTMQAQPKTRKVPYVMSASMMGVSLAMTWVSLVGDSMYKKWGTDEVELSDAGSVSLVAYMHR